MHDCEFISTYLEINGSIRIAVKGAYDYRMDEKWRLLGHVDAIESLYMLFAYLLKK